MIHKKKGITLIELIMVIIIVAVLVGVSSMYIKEIIDLWRFLSFRNEVVSEVRLALSRMQREIREVRDSLSISVASVNQFQFTDINENSINFYLSGNNLMRNSYILAGNVTSLKFCYYNFDNQPSCLPECNCSVSNFSDISRIVIEIQVTSGGQTKILRTQVYPRNL
ncbi:MAG: prepilin-type N-terminal cleavage/methylation domain-containing protein [Candidatus Omnitrophica bacterium]|nr:prepilin-type N-terminal cleavage/methylation domain-containing protein [Candidatus Omnitrophota bacterium]